MFKNWFTNKTIAGPSPDYVEEKCYVTSMYHAVYEGQLRRLKSGKLLVSSGGHRWFEANPDSTTKSSDEEIKNWFQ